MRTRYKTLILLIVIALLCQLISGPVVAAEADDQLRLPRPTIAYIHDHSDQTTDELIHLSTLPSKTYTYQDFGPKDTGAFWSRLSQFHVLIVELSGDGSQAVETSLMSHRNELANFVRSGGRLYVTLYGDYHNAALDWLPSPIESVPVVPEPLIIIDSLSTRLFSKPNVISDIDLNEPKTRQGTSVSVLNGVGYQPVIVGKTSRQPLLVYQTLGSGIVVVSGAELEHGFRPEWVENVIDPLPLIVVVVGKILIDAVAEHIVKEEIIKPKIGPLVIDFAQKNNFPGNTLIDEQHEFNTLVEAVFLAKSLKNIFTHGSKAIAQYGLARKATGHAIGGHMLWAYKNAIEALIGVNTELTEEVVVQPVFNALSQSQRDDLTSQLSPAIREQMNIANDFSYPYYLDNVMPEYAYTGHIDPSVGYSQAIAVPQGTSEMKSTWPGMCLPVAPSSRSPIRMA